jgi:GNAT superfamily N-acetyltransferase
MQGSAMIIAKAEKKDLKEILTLQYTAYQSEAVLLNNFDIPPLKQTLEEIEREYEAGIFLKATGASGMIIGSVRAYNELGTTYVGKLIVHSDRQGKGIGTKLLTAIEQACPARRYELFTSKKSIRNLLLYEYLGYERFKEEEVAEGLTFVFLEKYIPIVYQ